MRALLRIPNARIYLLGDVVSTIGDYSLWLAMAIWMKEMTGSSAWAGLVMFCFALGSLFSPLGGVIADRFPRRPLLICANLLAAADVLLLLLVHDRSLMWLVYAVIFAYGVIGSVTDPAETALLPSIVPADLLAEANGAPADPHAERAPCHPAARRGALRLAGRRLGRGRRRCHVRGRGGLPGPAAGPRIRAR